MKLGIMYYKFFDSTVPDRERMLVEDRNPEYLYQLLSKHLREPIPELKKKYVIDFDWFRRIISIEGNCEDIYELFNYLYGFDVKFLSIGQTRLRVDINNLLYKIK